MSALKEKYTGRLRSPRPDEVRKAKAPNIAAATACSGGSTGSSQTEVSPSLPRPGSYGDLETGPQELPDEILLG